MGFPCGSAGKETTCNVEDLSSIPGLGRSPGERKGYPLQYSGLENYMDCIAHGVTKSRIRLSDFHFHFHPLTSSKIVAVVQSPSQVCRFWPKQWSQLLSSCNASWCSRLSKCLSVQGQLRKETNQWDLVSSAPEFCWAGKTFLKASQDSAPLNSASHVLMYHTTK